MAAIWTSEMDIGGVANRKLCIAAAGIAVVGIDTSNAAMSAGWFRCSEIGIAAAA
jgi:hypothetical protein